MTSARHLLFVERFYTPAAEEQAEDRIRRIGQEFETRIWFLHALNTIDARLDEIIKTKRGIVAERIGSPTIEETELHIVAEILRTWGGAIEQHKPSTLLDPAALKPLPASDHIYAISFYKPRWSAKSAVVWTRMLGYGRPMSIEAFSDRSRLVMRPSRDFQPKSFKSRKLTNDLRIIVGTRRRGKRR